MGTITLDQSVANQLTACKQVTVLRDPQGTVLGTFDPDPLLILDEGEVPEFDAAELDRRVRRWEGIPSSEVRRVLEMLR